MRRSIIFWVFALVIMVFLPLTPLSPNTAHAATARTSAKTSRIIPFFTRDKWRNKVGLLPAGAVAGSGDLIWHNGSVQEHPSVFLVFWGSSWNNGSGGVTADGQVVENYFNDVAGTGFENILTQYYDTNTAHIFPTMNVAGIWLDPSTPPTDTSCGGSPTIQDQSIQSEVSNAAKTNGWPSAGTDVTYFIYTPNGDVVNAGGSCSETAFCAYHSFTSNLYGVAYAAMAYPSNLSGCGVSPSNSPNGNIYGDSLVNITSHEQFESITDPDTLSGWYDSGNPSFEIGDKCAWDFSAGLTHLKNGLTFAVQTEYSNATHTCINAYTPPASHMQISPASLNLVVSGTNPSPRTLTLSNSGTGTLNWSAAVLPPWLTLSPTSGAVAAGKSQALTLTFQIPSTGARQNYTTNLTLTDPNSSNTSLSMPISVTAASVSKVWYFAEGYTGTSFSEYLTIANPNTLATTVTVQYFLGSGSPITKTYSVAANSRYTILVNSQVGANKNVSMVVSASLPIIAERPMYFTYLGRIPGGTDVLGATQLGTTFDFGYLDTSSGYNTYLTILNQNSSAMTATIQYFPANGGGAITQIHQINANSRGTVYVNADGVAPGRYSALVTLSAPGLVERPLYFVDTFGRTGAADVVGVSTLQTDWYFAEGFTSANFNEYYIVSNPTGAKDAHISGTYLRSSGAPFSFTDTLPPGQQRIYDVGAALGYNNVNNSAVFRADLPILVERLMVFQYLGSIPGASDVLGAAAPTNLFYFAEGYTGGHFSEYLTIENPNSSAATVQVSYLPGSGNIAPTVKTYTVAANTRFTVNTNAVMPNQSFSMVVASSLPIVAERPMYFIYNGNQTGGDDVVGYQGDPPPLSGLSIYASSSDQNVYALNTYNGSPRWSYQMSGAGTTPAVANGVVYVGGGDDSVYALRSSDGAFLWKHPLGGVSGSSDLIVDNGVVYVESIGILFALDANTGTVIWQLYVGSGSPPIIVNGVVYVGTLGGELFALRASDGRFLWMYYNALQEDTAPAAANGIVYFGTKDQTGTPGNLYALDATSGILLWSSSQAYTQPMVANGIVYSSVAQGSSLYLVALNATSGAFLWNYLLGTTGISVPTVANGLLYLNTTSSGFIALNATTGALAWSYTATGNGGIPAVGNGVAYFSSSSSIYALQANTGAFIWSAAVGTGLRGSPTVAP